MGKINGFIAKNGDKRGYMWVLRKNGYWMNANIYAEKAVAVLTFPGGSGIYNLYCERMSFAYCSRKKEQDYIG